MEGVQIIVFASKEFWDEFYITTVKFSMGRDGDNSYVTDIQRNFGNESTSRRDYNPCSCSNEMPMRGRMIGDPQFPPEAVSHYDSWEKRLNFKQCYKTQMNGYLLSIFVDVLRSSEFYRSAVISHLLQCKNIEHNKYSSEYPLKLIIQLNSPKRDVIDYNWNERMLTMALEHRELDHAMSWLSTLGGAFSSLGDQFDYCAVVAGRISIKQMKLALRLGDPMTVARCKLWLALSLLQRGYLKRARYIIKEQYDLAKSSPVVDTRLIRMCHGIWAKLRYAYYMKKLEKT